jgi:uncharacterized protein YbaR (Trm112 family)
MNRSSQRNVPQTRDEATIDPKLLELLVCPLSKGPLTFDRERSELISKGAKLAFPVRDGIPVMLPSEARVIENGVDGAPGPK